MAMDDTSELWELAASVQHVRYTTLYGYHYRLFHDKFHACA